MDDFVIYSLFICTIYLYLVYYLFLVANIFKYLK